MIDHHHHAGLKSMLLERKLEAVADQLEMKEAQLAEVITAANLDPNTLQVGALVVCVCVWGGGSL